VVARVTRTVSADKRQPPQTARWQGEPDLDFTLGHPAPRPDADPSGHARLGAAALASDSGTVSVAVGDGGGDISPRLRIIQYRIDSVVELLRSARRDCPGSKGSVRIEFQIQPNGYPAARRLRASSGDPCLEEKAGAIIHLAEPYPYVSGWVPVTMDFN
jgi:TonB family protein